MPKTERIHPALELAEPSSADVQVVSNHAAALANFGLTFDYEETPDGGVMYEWYPGEMITLREPTGEDMLSIEQFYLNGSKSSIELTLSILSFLNTGINGGLKVSTVKPFLDKYRKLPLSKAMIVTKRIEVILKYFHFDDAMG